MADWPADWPPSPTPSLSVAFDWPTRAGEGEQLKFEFSQVRRKRKVFSHLPEKNGCCLNGCGT